MRVLDMDIATDTPEAGTPTGQISLYALLARRRTRGPSGKRPWRAAPAGRRPRNQERRENVPRKETTATAMGRLARSTQGREGQQQREE